MSLTAAVQNLLRSIRCFILGCDILGSSLGYMDIWGFPKVRGTFFGVPIMRITIFWGLYWGPLILGNYQLKNLWGGRGAWGLGLGVPTSYSYTLLF